jgi:hypothetical protein
MKKLLLVLVIVAMASFLLVGCIPGGTTPDGDGGDGGVVEATIAFDKEYTDASSVTFIPCSDTITVTLPTAAPEDYVVYAAVKEEVTGCEECETYICQTPLTPNTDRTVWTGTFAPTVTPKALDQQVYCVDECAPYCVVALLKHPCCAGEEIALRVVTPDCTAPDIPDFTFKCYDCNECESVCEPEGAYFTFTSMGAGDACNPGEDDCYDACSGVGEWSFTVGGVCDLCTLATGSDCPVEGTAACGCLPWATETEETVTYDVEFEIADNVGNKVTATYHLTVDTDSVTECMVIPAAG